MKKNTLYAWALALLSVYVAGHFLTAMKDWQTERITKRSAAWEKAAHEQNDTVEIYHEALQSCSYIIGQHIYILNGMREAHPDFLEKYTFPMSNLERETPALQRTANEARAMRSKYKMPIFLY